MNRWFFDVMDSPLGPLLMVCDEQGLRTIRIGSDTATESHWSHDAGMLFSVRQQLQEYFAGSRQQFTLNTQPAGSEFQQRVWRCLSEIPYGGVISYKELAGRAGHANAARAAGGASGRNPIPIVIPCHRVINADGSLGGFSSGIAAKRTLLTLEGYLPRQPDLAL